MTSFWNMNALHRVWLMLALATVWCSMEGWIP